MSDEADMAKDPSRRSSSDMLRQLYRDRGWRGIALLVAAVVTGLSLAALNLHFPRLGAQIERDMARCLEAAESDSEIADRSSD